MPVRSIAQIAFVMLAMTTPRMALAQQKGVPDADAVDSSIQHVRELFADDYASRDPQKRSELVEKLLAAGRESQPGSADQYALLTEASRLAFISQVLWVHE